MKLKEKQSFASQSKEELHKEAMSIQVKLSGFTIDRFTKQMKNSREARELRKRLAVINTFITAKGVTV